MFSYEKVIKIITFQTLFEKLINCFNKTTLRQMTETNIEFLFKKNISK